MLLTMHYNRITLLTVLILFSLLTFLHHIHPNPNVHLPGNVHNVLSYFSGPGTGRGSVISGRKITQNRVLELGTRKGVVDMDGEGDGKKDAKRGEKIPRIIHQIWINYEGGFEHAVGLEEGKKEERKKNEGKDKADKKERGGKSTTKEKWEVTGMEGLEYIPQEWEERRRTCRGVNRGWKVYIWTAPKSQSFIQTHYPSFKKTYVSYAYHWQRVQALKYLLLSKYGGVVLDWDTQCEKPMDALVGVGIGLFVGSWESEGNGTGRGSEDDIVDGSGKRREEKSAKKGGGWVDRRVIGGRVGHGFFESVAQELGEGRGARKGKKLGRKQEDGDKIFEAAWEAYHAWLGRSTTNSTVEISLLEKGSGRFNKKPGDRDTIGWRLPLHTAELHKRFWAPHLDHSSPGPYNHKHPSTNPKKKGKTNPSALTK